MTNLDTTCPDCGANCDTFEILKQSKGYELWFYCENCGMETFREYSNND